MPFHIRDRVEQLNPTERVRGTVVNVTPSGVFIVKFDIGDYQAYQPEQDQEFGGIPHLPIPGPAREMIRMLSAAHGRTPPEDAAILTVVPAQAKLPGQTQTSSGVIQGER